MIIGDHNNIYDVTHFMGGLERSAKALLRVATSPGHDYTFCSGWLLTDTLVVIPDYAAGQRKLFCHPYSSTGAQPEPIEANLLWVDKSNAGEGSGPALLRLAKPITGAALSLETRSPVLGDGVMVLQHADGALRAHFSLGSITGVEDTWIKYNASTSVGSSGGPIINIDSWKMVGMHIASLRDENLNRGLRIDPMLDALRHSGAWLEIVKFHNLAEAAYTLLEDVQVLKPLRFKMKVRRDDLESRTVEEDGFLVEAALSWSFDPAKLNEEQKTELQPLVVDAKASTWSLKAKERQRILRTAGSLRKMNKKLPKETLDKTGQLVIKDILKGAPFALDKKDEEQLSYWLQAVRWFEGIVPGLPSPAEVNTTLERKRTRSKLQHVIRGFRGRKAELKKLLDWYNDGAAGPMLITGIGGMGKSALVGYFVNSLPSHTLLLWLDFDRPDLAPDDALSVLNAIAKQAAVQLDGFEAPELSVENWKAGAKELGLRLSAATKHTQPPLVILDGFEVAQHTKEYHEIWQVLEAILEGIPSLKVIVSGRAPVSSLKLQNKEATPLPLEGLAVEDAEAWLRERGIDDEQVLQVVLKMAEGIPLRLKLAVKLVEAGEKVQDLPGKLPQAYITGYLYQRILHRVIDAELMPLVEDILVLRKCSKSMLVHLVDKLPQGLTAEEVFERLAREIALVGETENISGSFVISGDADKLELRPEVRSATLRLLELNDAARVRATEEKAVEWYKGQDLSDGGNAAELVYHLLRLKKLNEAKLFFRIECVPLLRDAVNDLPEDAAAERYWLQQKTGTGGEAAVQIMEAWEVDAALDIKNKLGRGFVDDMDSILQSRAERTAASPLLVYDAFSLWRKGELKAAIDLLEKAEKAKGNVQRDRMLLHALLLSENKEWEDADKLLEQLQTGGYYVDWVPENLLQMMLLATRVRLTVDIENELKLYEMLGGTASSRDEVRRDNLFVLSQFLTASDIVTPFLNSLFARNIFLENFGAGLKVPNAMDELRPFQQSLQAERFKAAPFAVSLEDNVTSTSFITWRRKMLGEQMERLGEEMFNTAWELAYKGYKRWRLATSTMILHDLCRLNIHRLDLSPRMHAALSGTLTAFRGEKMKFGPYDEIDKVMDFFSGNGGLSISEKPSARNAELLTRCYFFSGIELVQGLEPGKPLFALPPSVKGSEAINSITTYLTTPSPLELLCRNILGLPENYKLIP